MAERLDEMTRTISDGTIIFDKDMERIARERTLAALMIRGADPTIYGTLIAELSNRFARGQNEYPTDMTAAASMLTTYKPPVNQQRQRTPTTQAVETTAPAPARSTSAGGSEASGVVLTYADRVVASVPGSDGVLLPGLTCFQCGGYGHRSRECPSLTGSSSTNSTKGLTLVQHAFMLAQAGGAGIDPEWILLDSQSTISVFNNPNMLKNIRRSSRTLRAITNGGHQDSTLIGDFGNLGEVWFNKESIANILLPC